VRGHVRRHGNGWAVVIDLGRNVPCMQCPACRRRYWLDRRPPARCEQCGDDLIATTGRRQSWHRGFPTKKEAEKARTELLGRVDTGAFVAPVRQTLAEYLLEEWLPARRVAIKPGTWENYRMQTNAYVLSHPIGSLPLVAVDGPTLNAYYADLLIAGRRSANGGLSNKSVRNIHGMLHKALADAVRWGRVLRNATDAADQPRKATVEMNVWRSEELRRFVECTARDRMAAAWHLLVTTGMRRGELLGLRWGDIDMQQRIVSIRQSRTSVNYSVHTDSPKTERGTRVIALDPETTASLQAHHWRQLEERMAWGPTWADSGLIFVREDGSPVHPQRLSQWFAQAVRKAGASG
jgi:integrase